MGGIAPETWLAASFVAVFAVVAAVAWHWPGFLPRIRQQLSQNLAFLTTALICVTVLFAVDQVRHIWWPFRYDYWLPSWPGGGRWIYRIGWPTIVVWMLTFHISSLFVVLPWPSTHGTKTADGRWGAARVKSWAKSGPRRLLHPLYWADALTWRLAVLASEWLVWVGDRVAGRGAVRTTFFALAASAGAAVLVGLVGPPGHSSRVYPLAGVACQNGALMLMCAAIWLAAYGRWNGLVVRAVGQLIAWLTAVGIVGDLVWWIGGLDAFGHVDTAHIITYRLSTVWSFFTVITAVLLLARLVDLANAQWEIPIRLAAFLTTCALAAVWTAPSVVSSEDAALDHVGPQNPPRQWAEGEWFKAFKDRVASIPEGQGPAVIVAASGGGSRAAIFTALVLEELARTNLTPPRTSSPSARKRVLAENIIFVSSVSGGSLATGHFVHALIPNQPPAVVTKGLRFTDEDELRGLLRQVAAERMDAFRTWENDFAVRQGRTAPDWPAPGADEGKLKDEYETLRQKLARQLSAADPDRTPVLPADLVGDFNRLNALAQYLALARPVLALAPNRINRPDLASVDWVFSSRGFDEMCCDFMAPILRGVLSPTLDRGDALARFWAQHFQWQNSDSVSGYARRQPDGSFDTPAFGPHRPLVLFNATDVDRGSRLTVGFPPLPPRLWQFVYDRAPDLRDTPVVRGRPRALSEYKPNAPIGLARAVRLSSNFPWGFRVSRLTFDPMSNDPTTGSPLAEPHVLDGGVSDNTGLDTVYELLNALDFFANLNDAEKRGDRGLSDYRLASSTILAKLRRCGVLIVEIDSGLKPTDQALGPFSQGATEPVRALNNASYTNAELAKQRYLSQMTAILERPDPPSTASIVRHYHFQCNHDPPGPNTGREEVMTAWALGPEDKAKVASRFFIDQGLWEERWPDLELAFRPAPPDQPRYWSSQQALDQGSQYQRAVERPPGLKR